jgi:hypothetical protein
MDTKAGRSPFEIRSHDRDYSGLSIADRYLADTNIERSFFNGVNLSNCAFAGVKMNNTEFSEANVKSSDFTGCDLSGSDFVDSLFENTAFLNCNFEKGEWRDAAFRQCRFVECNFDHTTVTVCTFIGCEFDRSTIDTAEHRAIYFNVFSQSKFGKAVSERHFSSRNFGIPATADQNTLVAAGSETTIEQMCLLNNVGKLRVLDVARVAEVLCASLAGGAQRRTSTLTFFAKIVRTLTDEHRISATSLVYLEELVSRLASSVNDQDLFTAAVSAMVEIRSALFAIATETANQNTENADQPVTHITILFAETYVRTQAEALRETLAAVAGGPNSFSTESVKNGSTIIDLFSQGVVSLGALLVSTNFVLRQAKLTVKLSTETGKSIKAVLGKSSRRKGQARSRRKPGKVPAIMKTGPVSPSLAPVRAAVHRHGRVLVEMDEKADVVVTVSIQHRNRR